MFRVELQPTDNPTAQAPWELDEEGMDLDESVDVGILPEITAALQEANAATFLVSGFGQDPWPVDVSYDLLTLLEDLPGLLDWLDTRLGTTCDVDFCGQGTERFLRMTRNADEVRIEDRYQGSVETISAADLDHMMSAVLVEFVRLAKKFCLEGYSHWWFQKWCAQRCVRNRLNAGRYPVLRGYNCVDPGLGLPEHKLSDDAQVRCLCYLMNRLDEFVAIPAGALFEIIPVEYLGGPYPAIGLYTTNDEHSGSDLVDWSLDAGTKLEAYIAEVGVDRLVALSAGEDMSWNDVLRRFDHDIAEK